MGLLSKKTIVCEMCGKEFQVRLNFGSVMCKECFNKHKNVVLTKNYTTFYFILLFIIILTIFY